MGASTKTSGDLGEEIAVGVLTRCGMTILARKYRFDRGEIDIVAQDGDVLVFCEVKLRYGDEFGDPEYAVTKRKQAQLKRVAEGYYFENEIKNQECRFDVVAITMKGNKPSINHLRNAFW